MRDHSRGEWIADMCVHAIGVTAGVIAASVLIAITAYGGDALHIVSVTLYAVGLLAMLVCSTLYHGAEWSPRRALFRRFDHAAIFVLIAGTYTPFMLTVVGGAWGYGMLAFVWLVASGGIAIKLLYPGRFERLSIAVYLALGWAALVVIESLTLAVSGTTLVLLAVGGVLYSVGMPIHFWRRLPYHNVIWHGFVLAAASCHYVAVLDGVVLAAS